MSPQVPGSPVAGEAGSPHHEASPSLMHPRHRAVENETFDLDPRRRVELERSPIWPLEGTSDQLGPGVRLDPDGGGLGHGGGKDNAPREEPARAQMNAQLALPTEADLAQAQFHRGFDPHFSPL